MKNNLDEEIFELYKTFSSSVNSVGIGKKSIRNQTIDTEAIVFAVDQKKDKNNLKLEEIIPPIISIDSREYPTDIIVGNSFAYLLGSTGCSGCSGVGINGEWSEKHRSLLPVNEELRCGVYIGCNPENGEITNVQDGRNDYTYDGNKKPPQGTLGAILIDDVDNTIYGLTAGHNLIFSNYRTGDYKFLQENGTTINPDNIFVNNSGCPVTSVYQPDLPDFGPSQDLGPVKRYYPLKASSYDPESPDIYPNYIDAAVFAFPKGTEIAKDSWKQLNFILNEDLKKVDIKVAVAGLLENTDTDKRIFVADVIIEDKDNYRKYKAWLTGEDSKYFELDMPAANSVGSREANPKLYLKKDVLLDFEVKQEYNITICVKDYNSTTRGPTEVIVDETTKLPITTKEVICSGYSLEIYDDNDVYTIGISGINNVFPENYVTFSGIHLANISLNDIDEKGVNVFSLIGKDAPLFMLLPQDSEHPISPVGFGPEFGQSLASSGLSELELWYKPNLEGFNYEVQNKYSVIIEMIDYSLIGKKGPLGLYYSFNVTDVNEFIYNFFIVDLFDTLYEEDFYLNGEIYPLQYNLKVAEVYWLEPDYDIQGNHKIEIIGDDADYFFVDVPDDLQNTRYGKAPIYLKAGTVLDHETKSEYNIVVRIYDELLPDAPPLIDSYKLVVTNLNDPSYGMFLGVVINNIDENTTISNDLLLANIGFNDQDERDNNYLIVGEQSEYFKTVGSGLYLIAGTSLDYEYISEYPLKIYGYNNNIEGSQPLSVNYTLFVNDLEDGETTKPGPAEEPTIQISPTLNNIDENTSTASRIAVADIETSFVLTDPPYEYAIYGPDSENFHIENDVLYLNQDVILNYETQKRFNIIVVIEKLGWNVASATYELFVNKVNYAPSSIQILNPRLSIKENTDTSYARIPLGVISYIDDGYGTNVLFLSGNDAVFFEIDHNILYLKTGVVLNYEEKPYYSIFVHVADPFAVNLNVPSTNYTLSVIDVNENPILIDFIDTPVSTLAEDTPINDPIYLGSLQWLDPDIDVLYLDSNIVKLYGLDSVHFSIVFTNGVYELYLNSGTILDHDIKPVYDITICVVDHTLSGNIPVCINYQLNITKATKIGYLLLNEENYLPITKIEHATYTDDPLELAEIISYTHAGVPQCGTYTIAAGLYSDNFYIQLDDNDCSLGKLFLDKNVFMDFWENTSQCITIECSQTNGETVYLDYCMDILQPYYPLATKQEIDGLTIGTRVWFVGGSSGFAGQNACPLEIKQKNVSLKIEKSLEDFNFTGPTSFLSYYYNTEKASSIDTHFLGCLSFGYKYGNLEEDENSKPVYAGDSGAVLLADFGGILKIIGLIFAAGAINKTDSSYNLGYACRADKIGELLEVKIDNTNHILDDPNIYYKNDDAYTDPDAWKFIVYDRLTNSFKRLIKTGIQDNEVVYDTYYQVGTYKHKYDPGDSCGDSPSNGGGDGGGDPGDGEPGDGEPV